MPLPPRMVRASRAILMASRYVVQLADRDLVVLKLSRVLEPTGVEGEEEALLDLQHHVGQLALGELVAGERLVELFRCWLYRSTVSYESRAAPMAPQMMPYRASFRQANGPLSPTTFGSTASAGSRTSSK